MTIDYAAEFAHFGAAIERRWRQSSFHPAQFPAIAAEALGQIPDLDFDELLLQQRAKLNPTYRFSDYDIYIFQSDLFRIEVLYWVTGATAIHQHAFSGAFKLALGRSFHVEYDFTTRHEVTPDLLIGDLRRRTSDVLEPGAIRQIGGGSQFIHANYHMVRPTVTIVIRTVGEWIHGPQLGYQYPHLASFPRETRRTRPTRLVELIARTGNWELLDRAIDRLWPDPTLENTIDILELPIVANNPARLRSALSRARERYPEFGVELEAVMRENRRTTAAEQIRRRLREPNEKFLMTLLLNLHDREAILRHLGDELPDETPSVAAARLLSGIGIAKGLPQVPVTALPELVEVIDGRRHAADAPALRPLLEHEVPRYLFPSEVRAGRTWDVAMKAGRDDVEVVRPFACDLDAALLDLLPHPTPPAATAAMVLNPVRYLQRMGSPELPAELAGRVVVDGSLRARIGHADLGLPDGVPLGLGELTDHNRLWVAHPVTGIMQPYELDCSVEARLAALAAGEIDVSSLPPALLSVLVASHVLIPKTADDAERRERQALIEMRRHLLEEHYVVLPSIISPLQVAALRRHFRSLWRAGYLASDDTQVVGQRDGVYCEFISLFYQEELARLLGRFVPTPLKSAYNWFFRYKPGAVLHRHTDRAQCRWNVSLAVDAEPDGGREQAWPFYIQVGDRVRTVKLGLGDCVLYSGTDLPHWRDTLPEGRVASMCLFHYVDADFTGDLG